MTWGYTGPHVVEILSLNTCLKVKVKSLSRVWLFSTLWTTAYQAPPSMEFSRQGYWSGVPFPSPGNLPDPGIKPGSPALQTLYRLSRQGSPKYLLMTLLMLLAILFEFSLFYQVTVSCITRCMTEPQIKVIMTRELKTIDQIYSSVIRSRIVTVEVYIRG